MQRDYWHKQVKDEPLFPDLLWSRPENRAHAGKLFIAGGNKYSFSAAANGFTEANKAGVGVARALLPNSLQKTVGRVFEAGEYAPSTPSGSFAQESLAEFISLAQWADGTLLAGDFGRNSETAILLEKFMEKYDGPLNITQDAADYFIPNPLPALARQDTLFVISFAQLQKMAVNAKFTTAFRFDMDFLHLIDALHEFTSVHQVFLITKHLDMLFVALNGRVSTTKLELDMPIWRVKTAAYAGVWWLQNPAKPFEALSTAVQQIATG